MYSRVVVKRTQHLLNMFPAVKTKSLHTEPGRTEKVSSEWSDDVNNTRDPGKEWKCSVVQHLFSNKFDRAQTSHNKTEHH